VVVTTSGFLNYKLQYFIDEYGDTSEDGLLYSDDNLTDCSPLMLNLVTLDLGSSSGNDTPVFEAPLRFAY
jgi:hypothetical protein